MSPFCPPLRRERRQKKIPAAIAARTAIPPINPPTMAPTGVCGPGVGVWVGEVGDEGGPELVVEPGVIVVVEIKEEIGFGSVFAKLVVVLFGVVVVVVVSERNVIKSRPICPE